MAPAAVTSADCSAPAPASLQPEAKATAPPAPIAESRATASTLACRLMPRNAASGGAGSGVERGQAAPPAHLGPARMDRPDLAREPHGLALRDDVGRPAAAQHGERARAQQPGEVAAHAPSGRSSSRETMWRWISEVPSQMRSTRASRQNRSTGRSSIRPMPPNTCRLASVTRPSISEA